MGLLNLTILGLTPVIEYMILVVMGVKFKFVYTELNFYP